MQFSNTTSNNGIIQMIERTTNQTLGAISGSANELAYFTNLVNFWYSVANDYIVSTNKEWHFDDSNNTSNFPIATTTLKANQRDYALPSTFRRIRSVEYMDANGKYHVLEPIADNDEDFDDEKMQEDAGVPTNYYKLGTSLIIYPKPLSTEITATAGLRLTYERTPTFFDVNNTTQEPGFDSAYHPILYYGPSYEWASIKGKDNVVKLCIQMLGGYEGLEKMIKKHYANRDDMLMPRIGRKAISWK